MGATPLNAIPWPEPTAPVRQGAAAMRSMAESIDGHWSGAALVRRVDMNVATATATAIAWSGAVNTPAVGGTVPAVADGITVGAAGLYLFHCVAHWNNNATGTRSLSALLNNAGIVDDLADVRTPSGGAGARSINDLTRVFRCAAGDKLNATVTQTSGVTLAMIWARLEVYRVA